MSLGTRATCIAIYHLTKLRRGACKRLEALSDISAPGHTETPVFTAPEPLGARNGRSGLPGCRQSTQNSRSGLPGCSKGARNGRLGLPGRSDLLGRCQCTQNGRSSLPWCCQCARKSCSGLLRSSQRAQNGRSDLLWCRQNALKKRFQARFSAASALKDAVRACCPRSLFESAGLGFTLL